MDIQALTREAIGLLDQLIATPSISRHEEGTASLIETFLLSHGVEGVERLYNNVIVRQPHFNPSLPTLLLNSHHDTVRPSASYRRDPFEPVHEDGRIYGLGSNDAGASVVSLMAAYRYYQHARLPFNLVLALSAEEEVMGEHGMRALFPALGKVDMALVGEPTGMQPAVGERGLVVLDCTAHGISGHAARQEGVNAIERAVADMARLRNYRFPRVSPLLGDVTMNVTQIEAGTQHNVIPDTCRFVIDVRTTDAFTNEEVVDMIQNLLEADAQPRSTRVHAVAISEQHPLTRAAVALGGIPYVSPTTSDRTLMHGCPALKMGVGQSARSHQADEYVMEQEIVEAIPQYIHYLKQLASMVES